MQTNASQLLQIRIQHCVLAHGGFLPDMGAGFGIAITFREGLKRLLNHRAYVRHY
jgi:hypothetical protein